MAATVSVVGSNLVFAMHHPDRCATVAPDHEAYKETVFEVDDKEQVVKMIGGAVGQRKRP